MNELVCIKRNEPVADSLQVAEMFGKRHNHVLRDIDRIMKTLSKIGQPEERKMMFIPSRRKAADGNSHRMYYMNRDGFSLLTMGFTGDKAMEWKLKYIEAFNRMEEIIADLIGADLEANVDYHDIYQHCKTKARTLQQAFA